MVWGPWLLTPVSSLCGYRPTTENWGERGREAAPLPAPLGGKPRRSPGGTPRQGPGVPLQPWVHSSWWAPAGTAFMPAFSWPLPQGRYHEARAGLIRCPQVTGQPGQSRESPSCPHHPGSSWGSLQYCLLSFPLWVPHLSKWKPQAASSSSTPSFN